LLSDSLSEPENIYMVVGNAVWAAAVGVGFEPLLLRICGILSRDTNVKRGRGRPKLTWGEAIKRDLMGWDIPRDLCLDRSAWKAAIDVPEP
jgi:hypothetical protein